jgi:hypothetical protein
MPLRHHPATEEISIPSNLYATGFTPVVYRLLHYSSHQPQIDPDLSIMSVVQRPISTGLLFTAQPEAPAFVLAGASGWAVNV